MSYQVEAMECKECNGSIPLVHGRVYEGGEPQRHGAGILRVRMFVDGCSMLDCLRTFPGANGGISSTRARHVLRQDLADLGALRLMDAYSMSMLTLRRVARAWLQDNDPALSARPNSATVSG